MTTELSHSTVNSRTGDGGGAEGLDLDLCLAVGGRAPTGRRANVRRVVGRRAEAIPAALEAQMLRSRERDRAAREEEEEALSSERPRRGIRVGGAPLPRFPPIYTPYPSANPYLLGLGRHHLFPMVYPYQQHVQCVPMPMAMPNEFALPYVMSYWGTVFSALAGGLQRFGRSVYRPVAPAGLPSPARARAPSKDASEATESGRPSLLTTDSTGSNSSTISHPQSGSVQGGGSICSDEHSGGPQTATEKPTPTPPAEQAPAKPLGRAASVDKPVGEQIPRAPLVSTTGDGPDGKTVNGFLHGYSDTGVKIMCFCHRRSFTAEEFVRHAGGTDVAQPLRHIVVTPRDEV